MSQQWMCLLDKPDSMSPISRINVSVEGKNKLHQSFPRTPTNAHSSFFHKHECISMHAHAHTLIHTHKHTHIHTPHINMQNKKYTH